MSNAVSAFSKMILSICKEEAVECIPLSDYWAFYLRFQEKENYIYGYQFGLNSAAAHSLCSDKSAASEVLSLHHVPNVEHICCMSPLAMEFASPAGNWPAIEGMLQKYGQIVLKDNHGTGGRGVWKASTLLEAEHAAQLIFTSSGSMAVCPYLPIENEYRVILLDNEIKLIYKKIRPQVTGDGRSTLFELIAGYLKEKKTLPSSFDGDGSRILKEGESFPLNWKHNLGQGARAEILDPYEKTSPAADAAALARKAAKALSVRFSSVDIVESDGGLQVLEVNSGVMMEYLSRESEELYRTAREIYRDVILKMMKE